jgi:hypothetical protein
MNHLSEALLSALEENPQSQALLLTRLVVQLSKLDEGEVIDISSLLEGIVDNYYY